MESQNMHYASKYSGTKRNRTGRSEGICQGRPITAFAVELREARAGEDLHVEVVVNSDDPEGIDPAPIAWTV